MTWHDQGHNQNPIQYVIHLSLLSICAKCGIKVLKIVFVSEFYFYLLFDPIEPSPGPLGGFLGGNYNCLIFYSSSPLIWYATWLCFEKLKFWPLPTPLGWTPGHDPAVTTRIPFNMLYVYHYWVYVQILA